MGESGLVANPHPSHPVREGLSVGTIIVADQIARCRFPRECLGDLLRQPLRRGMLGHREPQKLSSTMAHDQKGKQALKRQGRNQTKVDRRNRVRMVAQECPPRLRWRSSVFDHVLGDGRLRELEAKLEELAVDARAHNGFSLLIKSHPSPRASRRPPCRAHGRSKLTGNYVEIARLMRF
jgi:hypothetical protein